MQKEMEKPEQNTVTAAAKPTRRERRQAERLRELAAMAPGAAFEKATSIATAAAHKREMELERGAKVTRRERSELLRAMAAGIQACASVAYRIKQGLMPDAEMLQLAMTQPETLKVEIMEAMSQAPAVAHQVAEQAGIQLENQAAALALDATLPASAPPQSVAETQAHQVETRAPGRPSTYTDAEADRICEWIQSGKSLQSYCRKYGRQAATIYMWMRERPLFAKAYAQAHEDRADTLVEDMLEIADDAQRAIDITAVMSAKLRIETRKWIAERMRPTKYGTKVQVEQQGNIVFQLGVPQRTQQQLIDINPVQSTLDKA